MSKLLIPIHLDAKVVTESTPVPTLDGEPFATPATLEPGVHLHWALPDALTTVRGIDRGEHAKTALCPAVPDLWLVVRFEADRARTRAVAEGVRESGRLATRRTTARRVASSRMRSRATRSGVASKVRRTSTRSPVEIGASRRATTMRSKLKLTRERATATIGKSDDVVGKPERKPELLSAGRRWRAWVVDSHGQTATPFDEWEPPQERPAELLTAFGAFPSGAAIGHPGFGHWTPEQGDASLHGAAYYPHSGKRFGFHDKLEDLPADGEVSYVVIGWYSDRSRDPLFCAEDREALLRRWRLAYGDEENLARVLCPKVAEKLRESGFKLSSVQTQPLDGTRTRTTKRAASRELLSRAALTVDELEVRPGLLRPGMFEFVGPSDIVCHGAVVQVPLASEQASATQATPTSNAWAVRLSSSIQRASAELLLGEEHTIDELVSAEDLMQDTEALMQELESQTRTTAGFLGIPAELHARTFRTAPGESRFYAQIEVSDLSRLAGFADKLELGKQMIERSKLSVDARSRLISGHGLISRSVDKVPDRDRRKTGPRDRDPKLPQQSEQPSEPTQQDITDLAEALASAIATASTSERPLDPRWIRVLDRRRNAPTSIAPDMPGTASGGWWLDRENRDHLRAFLVATAGARTVRMPSASQVYEKPGPSWYKPGAPQLTIRHVDRSYRHGFDGRYEGDGFLRCRLGARTVVSCTFKLANQDFGPTVAGSALLAEPSAFSASAGVPDLTRALLEEALLLDPSNARLAAKRWRQVYTGPNEPSEADVAEIFEGLANAWLLLRQPDLTSAQQNLFDMAKSQFTGTFPSFIGIQRHIDSWNPLFVDLSYGHEPAELGEYELGEIEYEARADESSPFADAGQLPVPHYSERLFLSASLTKISAGAVTGAVNIDHMGNRIPKGPIDFDPSLFDREDLLSAPVVGLDERLRGAGLQLRSGRLQVLSLCVVDTFGLKRERTEHDEAQPLADPTGPSAPRSLLALSPRLPEWARLMFRFASAKDDEKEADFLNSPVCGFLLPDYIEHALEVFDGEGKPIGQLRADPPLRRIQGPATLGARFELHAWVMDPGDPLAAITNPHMREFVAGVLAQQTAVPDPVPDPEHAANREVYESPLTELMRLFDTIGGTVAWTGEQGERSVRLLGKAVALVRAQTWFETSAGARPGQDSSAPPHPPLPIQIGSLTQPDDGVYGVFVPGATPAESRFHPVDLSAAEEAVINGLRDSIHMTMGTSSLDHGFVRGGDQPSRFSLAQGEKRTLSVFVEVGGAVHLTTGVLPRKRLTLDPWFTNEALRQMEPTFRVGPVLAVPELGGTWQPLLPHPDLPGYEEWWVERPVGAQSHEVAVIKPLPAEGQLPSGRCVMTDGWFRLEPKPTSEDETESSG